MRLLLDTHTLLWWWNEDRRLTKKTRAIVNDPEAKLVVSAATVWEVATKVRIDKLPDLATPVNRFLADVRAEGFDLLDISPEHAFHAGSYPMKHADPFDRILAAQSELEGPPLVTRDPAFAAFPCKTRW